MFNIGMFEILVVLLVAFLVVGPKDLPKVARWIARQIKSIRRLVKEIKQETGWSEFAKEFKDTENELKETFKEADISKELKEAAAEVEGSIKEAQREAEQAAKDIETEIKGGNGQ